MKKCRKFTLVELLAAISIIAILAALGFAGYNYSTEFAKEKSSKALISRLNTGIEAIHNKLGYYPSCSSYEKIKITVNSNGIVDEIKFGNSFKLNKTQSEKNAQKRAAMREFIDAIDFDTLSKFLDGDGYICDAWGWEIYYRSPGSIHKSKFDLLSPGKDGQWGESNDPRTGTADNKPKNGYKRSDVIDSTTGEAKCDDIINE